MKPTRSPLPKLKEMSSKPARPVNGKSARLSASSEISALSVPIRQPQLLSLLLPLRQPSPWPLRLPPPATMLNIPLPRRRRLPSQPPDHDETTAVPTIAAEQKSADGPPATKLAITSAASGGEGSALTCPFCDRTFPSRVGLVAHLRILHSDQLPIDQRAHYWQHYDGSRYKIPQPVSLTLFPHVQLEYRPGRSLANPSHRDWRTSVWNTDIRRTPQFQLSALPPPTFSYPMDLVGHIRIPEDHRDALTVQCLLSINRSDLAGKTVRRMQVADEDALPSQLASAAFYLAKGGDKLNEALSIYQELQEKYKPTPLLLNGQAAALMTMGRWADAEPVLQQSLDLEPSHAETLINMMVVSQHTGKPAEIVNRFISQLRDCDKNHPFLDAINGTDQLFEEAKSQISVKIQKNVGSVKA
nr:unnamed protein product [Spirometra erinaceieuropaei]